MKNKGIIFFFKELKSFNSRVCGGEGICGLLNLKDWEMVGGYEVVIIVNSEFILYLLCVG